MYIKLRKCCNLGRKISRFLTSLQRKRLKNGQASHSCFFVPRRKYSIVGKCLVKDGSESKLALGSASGLTRAINIRRISVESELSVGNWSPATFRASTTVPPFTIRPGRFPFTVFSKRGTSRARTRSLSTLCLMALEGNRFFHRSSSTLYRLSGNDDEGRKRIANSRAYERALSRVPLERLVCCLCSKLISR